MEKKHVHQEESPQTLIVVPCGRRKVWDTNPDRGETAARDAYAGIMFRRNREYAERFGDMWVILSAKYGLISPDYLIPGSYDVSFNDRKSNSVTTDGLRQQVVKGGLNNVDRVVALGGKAYRAHVEAAFAGLGVEIVAPFGGLPIGKYLQALKRAVAAENPRIDPTRD